MAYLLDYLKWAFLLILACVGVLLIAVAAAVFFLVIFVGLAAAMSCALIAQAQQKEPIQRKRKKPKTVRHQSTRTVNRQAA